LLNPAEYARQVSGQAGGTKTELSGIPPPEVAGLLDSLAEVSMQGVSEIRSGEESPAELDNLLDDILGMSCLGQYYASKIRAASELALFAETGIRDHQSRAVAELGSALQYWKNYAAISEKNYKPQMLARTRLFDWSVLEIEVEKDLGLAQNYN
jgi:hypothetical protein